MNYDFRNVPQAFVDLIGEGLNLLPHGRVRNCIDFLQYQVKAQEDAVLAAQRPAAPPAAEAKPAKPRGRKAA